MTVPVGLLLRGGAVAAVLGVAFYGGCQAQKTRTAGQVATLKGELRTAAANLRAARDSLKASGEAIAVINEDAERRVREADERAAEWRKTAGVMESLRQDAEARADRFDAALRKARAKSKECGSLLDDDVEVVCEISLR